jgi:hypothetical protein
MNVLRTAGTKYQSPTKVETKFSTRSNDRQSPRLSFETSPSSFSAVGLLLGITAILAYAAEFKRRPAV